MLSKHFNKLLISNSSFKSFPANPLVKANLKVSGLLQLLISFHCSHPNNHTLFKERPKPGNILCYRFNQILGKKSLFSRRNGEKMHFCKTVFWNIFGNVFKHLSTAYSVHFLHSSIVYKQVHMAEADQVSL